MKQNNISDRIRELREEKGLTQLALSNELYVKQQSVAQWEKGERDLKSGMIIQIAKYFGVTTDYLLGLSEYRTAQAADIGAVTGLTEDSIANLKEISKEEYEIKNIVFDFIDDLLDYKLLAHLAVRYNEYKKNHNNECGVNLLDEKGQFVDCIQANEIMSTLLQKAFNNFILFAVNKQTGNNDLLLSLSRIYTRREFEKLKDDEKIEYIADLKYDLERGK